jgi:hypothetical protein
VVEQCWEVWGDFTKSGQSCVKRGLVLSDGFCMNHKEVAMLMLLMALSFVPGQPTQRFDYLPKNTTTCPYTGANLIFEPKWQIDFEEQTEASSESNLETWKAQRYQVQIKSIVPTKAVEDTLSRPK